MSASKDQPLSDPPRWCVLYRVTYIDGRVIECATRSWAETAEVARENFRRQPLAGGAIAFDVAAALPWTAENDEKSTAELFAALRDTVQGHPS